MAAINDDLRARFDRLQLKPRDQKLEALRAKVKAAIASPAPNDLSYSAILDALYADVLEVAKEARPNLGTAQVEGKLKQLKRDYSEVLRKSGQGSDVIAGVMSELAVSNNEVFDVLDFESACGDDMNKQVSSTGAKKKSGLADDAAEQKLVVEAVTLVFKEAANAVAVEQKDHRGSQPSPSPLPQEQTPAE